MWFSLVTLIIFHQPGFAGSLSLSKAGQVVKVVTTDDLARLLTPTQFKVHNPDSGQDVTYEGYRFTDLLNSVFGLDWQRYKTIEFGCSDGYRPQMATHKVSRHQGLIAIREGGKPKLEPLRRVDGSVVNLGEFYLVWENIHDVNAAKSTELSWPWQLESISLLSP